MSRVDELVEEINIDKEILSTLPLNNKKNTKIYLEKIEELSEKYKSYDIDIMNEIKIRARKLDGIKPSLELSKLDEELNNLECVLYLLNEVDSSYEKMDLDREISNLTYYYKKNLEKVNETIAYCIKKFEEVGIVLTPDDFSFNKYVNEYVSAIFKGLDSNGLNKNKINNKFEEIYWKCPEIITHIEINIRYLYLKNEKEINKYYKDKKDKLLRKFSNEEIKNNHLELKKANYEAHKADEYSLIKQFLDGSLLAKDYTKDAIADIVYKFTERNDLKEISDEEFEEIVLNLIKLLHSVEEFKNYNKFKFIIDNVKKMYSEKEQYKGVYAKTKKEIAQREAQVIKLGKPKLFKKVNEENIVKQTKIILELKDLYKTLDLNEVSDQICNVLTENSSLYDVLYLAGSFYKYLFNCLVTENKEIQEHEINKFVDDIKEFLTWPYFTILNNISISEEKDIMFIIKDRYNLLNINISKDDLAVSNLDSLITMLRKCETYYYLRKNNIDVNELSDIYEFKKILKNI